MNAPDRPFDWRTLAAPVFLPSLLFTVGESALIPLIPALAARAGAGLAVAGLVAAMMLVGRLLADIPAGWIVARVGERRAMLGALVVALVGLVLAAFAVNPGMLTLGVALIGAATAVFALARHALVTSVVPPASRARALSTLAGANRLGHVIGPLLSAAIITVTGGITMVFWLCLCMLVAVAASLLMLPDPEEVLQARRGDDDIDVSPLVVFRTIAARRGMLARLGTSALTVSALRSVRQVLLPLWAVSIGVGDAQIALVIGIAAAVDFALFYPGGWLMDRFGRLAVVVPTMIGMGIGFIVLALSAGAGDPVVWFIAVTMWLAVFNGISAGVIATIGADLADRRNPAPFLGAWRLIMDCGRAGSPLLLSALTALIGLVSASAVLGGIGFVGAGLLAYFIPRYLPRPND